MHSGIMASGSELIKDAAERDGLVEESDNKCVEMEEAELTNELPASLFSARCFISPVSVRHSLLILAVQEMQNGNGYLSLIAPILSDNGKEQKRS
jgi:hypothetical protein